MKIPSLNKGITLIVFLTIAECALVGYIGIWREGFWTSVQTKNLHLFFLYISYFSVAALGACFVSGYSNYIQSYTALIGRYKLSRIAFKMNLHNSTLEGYRQRIQEDCNTYPLLLITLSTGLFKSICLLVVYISILVYQLSFLYLIIPAIYAGIGTFCAAYLARPLVTLNYINQVFEARFRQALSKLNYSKAHRNNSNLFKATKKLAYFQYFYNQTTVIVPYLILFPIYFTSVISFGIFMQCASSTAQVIECMSYIVNSFNDINKWLSCRRRLKELKVII